VQTWFIESFSTITYIQFHKRVLICQCMKTNVIIYQVISFIFSLWDFNIYVQSLLHSCKSGLITDCHLVSNSPHLLASLGLLDPGINQYQWLNILTIFLIRPYIIYITAFPSINNSGLILLLIGKVITGFCICPDTIFSDFSIRLAKFTGVTSVLLCHLFYCFPIIFLDTS